MDVSAYTFEAVTACNMCGAADARVLGRRLDAHQGLRVRSTIGVATTVMRCESCGLVYSNPRPIPQQLEQHYDREPETYWASSHFSAQPDHFGHEMETFSHLWDGGGRKPRALDIGAGFGRTMTALACRGFEAFGLEPSPGFRRRALKIGIDPGRLQLGSLESADYEGGAFDLVTFGAVLEHLQDPATSITRRSGGLRQADSSTSRFRPQTG